MNRADRRRTQGKQFKAVQEAKRVEKRSWRMTPMQAREALGKWARQAGHTQEEIDRLNGRIAVPIDVKGLFEANCGPRARYLAHEKRTRAGFDTIAIQFEIIPEKRQFDFDQVVRGTSDDDYRLAVMKVAEIAKDIRSHLKPDDPSKGMNGHWAG